MTAPGTPIDLRSDTITRPTPAMREAMASAPVGDDQFGEDPSVNALQERVASLLAKDAALWMPSGTMANQVALRTLTEPGDEVLVSHGCHLLLYETGAAAANAGVQLTALGRRGVLTADDCRGAITPRGHMVNPPTTLVALENTHNRAGGVVLPQADVEQVGEVARERGASTYLDGARLWNAAMATRRSVAELAAPFDLVSVAFSKGLGAPGGSMLAGPRAAIDRARRYRRMLGGAMRQVGIFAAASSHALDHHIDRLIDDHTNARLIADRLAASPRIRLDPADVHTNIVIFDLSDDAPDAASVVTAARGRGVLVFAFGPRTVRVVTHLDVSRDACARAAAILAEVAETGLSPA